MWCGKYGGINLLSWPRATVGVIIIRSAWHWHAGDGTLNRGLILTPPRLRSTVSSVVGGTRSYCTLIYSAGVCERSARWRARSSSTGLVRSPTEIGLSCSAAVTLLAWLPIDASCSDSEGRFGFPERCDGRTKGFGLRSAATVVCRLRCDAGFVGSGCGGG